MSGLFVCMFGSELIFLLFYFVYIEDRKRTTNTLKSLFDVVMVLLIPILSNSRFINE